MVSFFLVLKASTVNCCTFILVFIRFAKCIGKFPTFCGLIPSLFILHGTSTQQSSGKLEINLLFKTFPLIVSSFPSTIDTIIREAYSKDFSQTNFSPSNKFCSC